MKRNTPTPKQLELFITKPSTLKKKKVPTGKKEIVTSLGSKKKPTSAKKIEKTRVKRDKKKILVKKKSRSLKQVKKISPTKKAIKQRKKPTIVKKKKVRTSQKKLPTGPIELRFWTELLTEKDVLQEKDMVAYFQTKKEASDAMRTVILQMKKFTH